MSAMEYKSLLFAVSERLDELNMLKKLLFMCREKLTPGSNIENALALFQTLEEQNYLGTDRLKLLKELLEAVEEWSLLDKVEKFENKRKEYKALLEKIRCALDELNDLERLITVCKGKISEEREENIKDVRSLLQGLEDEQILGIRCLDILKELLTKTEKSDLLQEVEKFEERRNREAKFKSQKGQAAAYATSIAGWIKAPFVGGVSLLVENFKRAVTLVCNFRTVAGGLLTVNSGMALQKCSSRQDVQETFERVVLPSSNKLLEISNGSIRFTVEAENLAALKELWDIYKDGTLQSRLQEFLVTDEIKQLANGEDIVVTVSIDEHEYNEAYFDLFLLHRAPSVEQQDRPGRRTRRKSDSFLCFKPNENETALMKLMEEKWRKEKQILELRITELEETLKVERTSNLDQYEILERPRKRRRRNSDSNLDYRARKEDIKQTENEPEQVFEGGAQMDFDKRMFVENCLQNIHETHSMTTETSDSGIRTHGATSEIEMQDISGGDHRLCWKDLSEDVIRKLEARLRSDEAAWKQLLRSFGIDPRKSSYRIPEFSDIFGMFPDTPVKELREVFEALQLYDLIDLLEEGKPRTTRSLRTALPLQDMERLRNPGDRPISYHSSVAVLIIEFEETCNTVGIEKFFKGLNLRNEITVVSGRDVYERCKRLDSTSTRHLQEEVNKLRSTSLEVIQRWIFNQDKFSLVAVFFIGNQFLLYHRLPLTSLYDDILRRLVTAFPTKVKLIIDNLLLQSPWEAESRVHEELVQVSRSVCDDFLTSMLEIFTKRWQTMDLISMMREMKRTEGEKLQKIANIYSFSRGETLTIKENLSCLIRFIIHEEPTN